MHSFGPTVAPNPPVLAPSDAHGPEWAYCVSVKRGSGTLAAGLVSGRKDESSQNGYPALCVHTAPYDELNPSFDRSHTGWRIQHVVPRPTLAGQFA